MRTKYLILLILLLIGISSCVSDKEQSAVAQVAAAIKAGNSKVGYSKKVTTDAGNYKAIRLEFSDFHGLEESMTSEKLASIAALLYVQQIDQADYLDFDKLEITIKRGKTDFVKLYDIKDVQEAEQLMESVYSFLDGVNNNSFVQVRENVDPQHISDSALVALIDVFHQMDSIEGKLSNVTLTGFDYNTVESTGEPVMETTAEGIRDQYLTTLYFLIKRDNKKIIGVGVNEE